MRVLKQHPGRKPRNGHHFLEAGVELKAETFPKLLEKVKDARLANGIPLGDVEGDVLAYYDKVAPWMVENGERAENKGFEQIDPILAKMRAWLDKVWVKPPPSLILPREAKERWVACGSCEKCVKFKWGFGAEMASIRKRLYLLQRGIETPVDASYCSVHNWNNGLASLLPKPATEADPSAPDGCYVRKI